MPGALPQDGDTRLDRVRLRLRRHGVILADVLFTR
jgi:hypothetical protein